jgi:hypothetical protein
LQVSRLATVLQVSQLATVLQVSEFAAVEGASPCPVSGSPQI